MRRGGWVRDEVEDGLRGEGVGGGGGAFVVGNGVRAGPR